MSDGEDVFGANWFNPDFDWDLNKPVKKHRLAMEGRWESSS